MSLIYTTEVRCRQCTETLKKSGPDSISVKLLEALEDYGIHKITTILNTIYETGQIPPDISKSIFITLPKKPGATKCEVHIKRSRIT